MKHFTEKKVEIKRVLPNNISILNGTGSTNIATWGIDNRSLGAGGRSVAIADTSGDGRVDLIIDYSNSTDNRTAVLKNSANGSSILRWNLNIQNLTVYSESVKAADLDSNGVQEIIAADGCNGIVVLNKTSGTPIGENLGWNNFTRNFKSGLN